MNLSNIAAMVWLLMACLAVVLERGSLAIAITVICNQIWIAAGWLRVEIGR